MGANVTGMGKSYISPKGPVSLNAELLKILLSARRYLGQRMISFCHTREILKGIFFSYVTSSENRLLVLLLREIILLHSFALA